MNSETYKSLKSLQQNIEKVFIGKKEHIELMLVTLLSRSHVLLDDLPGVGKTTLAQSLAKSIKGSFKRIQFTPDVMPTDITGFNMFNPKEGSFEFIHGAVMANIVLADEINRTPPKTQASLMEVMEEKQVSVDGVTHYLPTPFMVIATQNPVESLGTYTLPEAQMDRFLMRISIGYPSRDDEWKIIRSQISGNPLQDLTPVIDNSTIELLQDSVDNIYIDDILIDYIISLSNTTRNNPDIHLGISPRGSLHLTKASRALALLRGRDYVIPDDIIELAIPVLAHRLVLHKQKTHRQTSPEAIIGDALSRIPVPVVKKNAYK